MRAAFQGPVVWSVALLVACESSRPVPREEAPRAPPASALSAPRAEDAPSSEEPRDPVPEARPGLALGARHTCLLRQGRIRCWGDDTFHQLGRVDGGGAVIGIPDPVRITAGSFHTCALASDGTVRCFGHGGHGQLGDGVREDRAEPVTVAGLTDAVEITAGEGHTCARRADRTVVCWGDNSMGQLGDGTRTSRLSPAPVTDLTDVRAIAAGRAHTCAIHGAGVSCWGLAVDGEVGDPEGGGLAASHALPRPVELEGTPTAIAAGAVHTCALMENGGVLSWGGNDSGQLGDGKGGRPKNVSAGPVAMTLPGPALMVAPGGRHTCVLLTTLEVRCAGFNHDGAVGDGTTTLRRTPVPTKTLPAARVVATGARHSCALLEDQSVRCWGKNQTGQLGDGTTKDRLTPVIALGRGNPPRARARRKGERGWGRRRGRDRDP